MHLTISCNSPVIGWRYAIRKILVIKLMVLLLFVCIQVSATSNAQEVTISKTNAPLKQILGEIERQSGCHFFYKDKLLKASARATIDVKGASVAQAMEHCLKNLPLEFSILDNIVIIKEKQISKEAFPPAVEASELVEITGTVKDMQGSPLQGVSVLIKGTKKGISTNADGIFVITANPGDMLEFSMIGYKTVSVKVGTSHSLDIRMEALASTGAEVIVIGYGTQKRSEVTGSVTNVKGADLSNQPVTSFESSLNGRATGVSMTASAGVLNQTPVFRIRGTNSLSLSSYPLIVIDGVPSFTNENESNIGYASTNPLSAINPADIESIDIAKDAAATSIYGSRAANGVVFITTKKGKQGAAKVALQSWVGINKALNLPKLLNAEQYIEIKNEGLKNDNSFGQNNYYGPTLDAKGNTIDARWSDYIYQTGVASSNNISISGGTQATKYYGSIGYTQQNGVFRKNSFNRKSVLFNVDSKANSWLSVGGKINYVNENNSSGMSTGAAGNSTASGVMARTAIITAPIVGPYNADGSYNSTSNGFVGIGDNAGHLNQSRLGFYNPVISLNNNYSVNNVNNIQSNIYLQITPFPGVNLRSTYGIDYRFTTYDNYFSPISGEGIGTNGSSSSANVNRQRWVWTNTASLEKTIKDDHSINLLVGEEEQKTNGKQFGLQREGQTDPFYSNIQGGWQNLYLYNTANQVYDNYLFSLFSRVQYNFMRKYYLTANYRQDEYSALGFDNKKGNFWGFSMGWEMNKEKFWENSVLNDVFSSFKLRASYGKVGNVGGLSDFGALNTYSATLYGGQSALVYSATGNPKLKWETSKKTDIGLSFGLLENKITGEISYYKNNIDGLIFATPLPPSAGIPNPTANSILQNAGRMYNRGVELSVNVAAIKKEMFSWNVGLNLTTNKNRVISLSEGIPSIIAGSFDTYTITSPGSPVGMLYVVRTGGVDPETGRRIFIDSKGRNVYYQHAVNANLPAKYQWSYEDGSRAPAISPAADAVPYKTAAPKIFGGLNNTLRYRDFELNFLITYQFGGNMIDGTQATMHDQRFWNNSADVLDRWQKPGDVSGVARIINGDNVSAGNTMPLDFNVSSSDFVRLKNAMISYNMPSFILSKIRLSNAKVYVSGQNLAIITPYTGMDPEVTSYANDPIRQGLDKNQAPNARTITAGVNITF